QIHKEPGAPDIVELTVYNRFRSFSGNRSKIFSLPSFQIHMFFLGFSNDGRGKRMLRPFFNRRGDGQQLAFGGALQADEIRYNGYTFRERTGFVKSNDR